MIEINNKKLCESCFAEIEAEGRCPNCGFDKEEYEPDQMVLPMGTKLEDSILIGRVMGKGGFGVTYLGYDLRMNKVIAVKEYFPNGMSYRSGTEVLASDPGSRETFENGIEKFYTEAEMVSQFNGNPNIVGVYDYFRSNNTVYLIMEYLNGVTLKNYVKKHGKLTDGQALYVMDKMAAALSITHSAGVLHRDISPDNIMICLDGKVKLIDFGAARQIVAESSSNLTVVMKPGYTPIEQYTKKGKQGAWTDIYALGATVYNALTGKIIDDPYGRLENDTEFETNLHGINDTLWNVIKKCTMINASERYSNAIELRKALKGTTAPLQAEPIPLDSNDLKLNEEEISEETHSKDVTEELKTDEHIEVFTDGEKEGFEDYEEPAVSPDEGYNPDDNVYERTKTKKPIDKKLLIGILSGVAAAVAIVFGVLLFLNLSKDSLAGEPDDTSESGTETAPENILENSPTEFSVTPLIHLGFETADGLTPVKRTINTDAPDGAAAYTIKEIPYGEIDIAEGQGVVGNALYLNGKYGVDFNMVPINNDIYTISFWFNVHWAANYMTVLQMGRNIGMSENDATVAWIDFTKFVYEDGTTSFPNAWNHKSTVRNDSGESVWSIFGVPGVSENGRDEWCMVTVVADGYHYKSADGFEKVRAKFYLNGQLVNEADDGEHNIPGAGLSPYIFAGDGIEAHIGVNYRSSSPQYAYYAGYVDELYVFDKALDDEQVKELYRLGAPSGDSQDQDDRLPTAPVDGNAICTLGTPDRELEWGAEITDGYPLPDGATLNARFNLYSDAAEYYHTLAAAFTNSAIKRDLPPNADNYEGYHEYAFVRADWWGWGDEAYSDDFELSWTDHDAWMQLTTDAKVDLTISRSGSNLKLDFVFTGADGTVLTETARVTTSITPDSPVYVNFLGEGAYIELLSVMTRTGDEHPALRFAVDGEYDGGFSYGHHISVDEFSPYFTGDIKVTLELEYVNINSYYDENVQTDLYGHNLQISDKSYHSYITTAFNRAILTTDVESDDSEAFFQLDVHSGEYAEVSNGRIYTFEFILTQEDTDRIDELFFRGFNCFVRAAIFEAYDPAEDEVAENAVTLDITTDEPFEWGGNTDPIPKEVLESFGGNVRITLDVAEAISEIADNGVDNTHLIPYSYPDGAEIPLYARNHGYIEDHIYNVYHHYSLGHRSLLPDRLQFVITPEQIQQLESGLTFYTMGLHITNAYLEPYYGQVK